MQEHPAQLYIQTNVQPPNRGQVNWKAAPLPFKRYHNCEQLPCTYEISEQPDALTDDGNLPPALLGQLLSDIYGLTRQCHMIIEEGPLSQLAPSQQEHTPEFHTSLLRPVPSGGALFPCELYLLVGPGQHFPPAGVYHYDPAHHGLDSLRQGDYSHLLQTYLAHPGDTISPYTFLLSCFFWKDGFKYGAFSYRLQGLDIGTIIGQSEIVSNHYNLATTVHYQFLDKAVDELIGLDPLHESIYAIITLSPAHQLTPNSAIADHSTDIPQEPVKFQPAPNAEQYTSIAYWPLLEAVHRASLLETQDALSKAGSLPPIKLPESIASYTLPPSDTSLNLWEARHKRHSAAGFFLPSSLTTHQLAHMLLTSTRGSMNDIDGQTGTIAHSILYCVVNAVEGIPTGIYYYHSEKHTLESVFAGEVQKTFQELLGWPNLHLFHASVCLIPVANYKDGFQIYADRWYRMQNMEAGIIAQRLYLAASALKLGCRANLGYPVPAMDTFLHLPEGYTSLVQLLIAPERYTPRYYAQSLLL